MPLMRLKVIEQLCVACFNSVAILKLPILMKSVVEDFFFSRRKLGVLKLSVWQPEAYLHKMAPVARIQIEPPLKYIKLCLSLSDLVSWT
jgi:hypothetical protein